MATDPKKDDVASAAAGVNTPDKVATEKAKCGPGEYFNPQTMKCEASKEAEALDAFNEQVAERVATKMSNVFQPMVEAIQKQNEVLTSVVSGMTQMASKMSAMGEAAVAAPAETKTETETETKTDAEEVAKSNGQLTSITDVLGKLAAGLQEVQKSVQAVERSNAALAKTTPAGVTREERVAVAKAAGSGDPNECFDHIWPFLGE